MHSQASCVRRMMILLCSIQTTKFKHIRKITCLVPLIMLAQIITTVELLNKGHVGASHFVLCREDVCSEVQNWCINNMGKGAVGILKHVLCREVISILRGSFIGGSTVLTRFQNECNSLLSPLLSKLPMPTPPRPLLAPPLLRPPSVVCHLTRYKRQV